MRANTEVRLALPSAKPSLPRGLLWGEPPNVPKNANVFSKNFRIQVSRILRKVDARRKRLRNRSAEPRDRLRLRDTASPLTSLRLSRL